MTAAELAGIALHADDPAEVQTAIVAAMDQAAKEPVTVESEYLLAECAHATGHMARRFGIVDAGLLGRVVEMGAAHAGSRPISGAIIDMWDDLDRFMPEARRAARPLRAGG